MDLKIVLMSFLIVGNAVVEQNFVIISTFVEYKKLPEEFNSVTETMSKSK